METRNMTGAEACYTEAMLDEQEFHHYAEAALEELKQHLFKREDEEDTDFETEEQGGVLIVTFDGPAAKFVITPNGAMRQIWISALATSFKLDWIEERSAFVLAKTGEMLIPLVDRLIKEQSNQ
jgi:iron donor protein CyaY